MRWPLTTSLAPTFLVPWEGPGETEVLSASGLREGGDTEGAAQCWGPDEDKWSPRLAAYVRSWFFDSASILAQHAGSCFPSSGKSQAECQLVRKSFTVAGAKGTWWQCWVGEMMTASRPSAVSPDRLLKGREGGRARACQEQPGRLWYFPGTSLQTAPENTSAQGAGAGWVRVPPLLGEDVHQPVRACGVPK
jgi:hypothetical protein